MDNNTLYRIVVMLTLAFTACKNSSNNSDMVQIEEPVLEEKTVAVHRFVPPEGWTEITDEDDSFYTDIRYATNNNFVNEIMYDCGKCFLRNEVAEKLFKVRAEMKAKGLAIKLFDCYRPTPVQQKLWDKVPNASYVTPPWRGSQHNRGVAVDLTLTDEEGKQLDMGTAFDFFGEEAHHTYKEHSKSIEENRSILKNSMERNGFSSIRTEWWHYSIAEMKELEVSHWEWECE